MMKVAPTILPHDDAHAVLQRIRDHQGNGRYHPLTCGKNSAHMLQGQILPHSRAQSRVILVCPDCDYRQNYIPSMLSAGAPS